jgi:hypothetical protein
LFILQIQAFGLGKTLLFNEIQQMIKQKVISSVYTGELQFKNMLLPWWHNYYQPNKSMGACAKFYKHEKN